ncbi:MAG TPA: hypothetical protein VL546_04025 [Steroidobacteraceae bacterium]|jgi:hypothetical protein|nr:hypothetical protein [Steroidobacteraceae bacterium]
MDKLIGARVCVAHQLCGNPLRVGSASGPAMYMLMAFRLKLGQAI